MVKEKGNRLFHKIDRWLGIPMVYILGTLRRKRIDAPPVIKSIALLNIGSIGDNVLMSGSIADLRLKYSDAYIVALTGNSNYHIVKLIDGIDLVVKLPITNPFKAISEIRKAGAFDLLFDFGPWPRLNAVYSFFISASFKVGFRTIGQHRHYVYDYCVIHSSMVHEIENHRNLVSKFYEGTRNDPSLIVKDSDSVREFINSLNEGSYCIIHPWPGGYKSFMKQWDDANWVELLYRIADRVDNIILTGAPIDNGNSLELEVKIDKAKLRVPFHNISGKFSLSDTVSLINTASFVISIDTGIAHISAALNRPLICIQGPANSKRWAPYSPNSIVVNPSRGTFGYLSYGFEYDKAEGDCMENISVDDVYEAFQRLEVPIYPHS